MIHSKEYKAIYKDLAQIELNSAQQHEEDLPDIPFGSELRIIIKFNKPEYLSGLNGIVWATHFFEQAETIQAALQAQKIVAGIIKEKAGEKELFLLKIENSTRIEQACNFIWKSKEGLRLKPDWHYPKGRNTSFEKWIG
jgi:hypothetical protein